MVPSLQLPVLSGRATLRHSLGVDLELLVPGTLGGHNGESDGEDLGLTREVPGGTVRFLMS